MTSSLVLNNQIRFQGNAAYAMVGIVSGAVINVILDPILIFVCDMGISGAALATVISQMCSFSLLLYMVRKGGNIRIRYRNFTPTFAFIKEIIGGWYSFSCTAGVGKRGSGFNYGAGLYARVRQGFWFCVKVGFFFLSLLPWRMDSSK